MVAAQSSSLVLAARLHAPDDAGDAYEMPRTGGVQPIGDLMAQVLARYLPTEDVWQERSRIALQSVRAAAG
jgi:hypothetical protein